MGLHLVNLNIGYWQYYLHKRKLFWEVVTDFDKWEARKQCFIASANILYSDYTT